jgi:hypothetical protein
MLIANLGGAGGPATGAGSAPAEAAAGAPAEAGADAPAEAGAGDSQSFGLGATVGAAIPDPALPTKTLEVRLYDEAGLPIPNHKVLLGLVDKSNKVDVRRAMSDSTGVARFTGLPTGEGVGYATCASAPPPSSCRWRGERRPRFVRSSARPTRRS